MFTFCVDLKKKFKFRDTTILQWKYAQKHIRKWVTKNISEGEETFLLKPIFLTEQFCVDFSYFHVVFLFGIVRLSMIPSILFLFVIGNNETDFLPQWFVSLFFRSVFPFLFPFLFPFQPNMSNQFFLFVDWYFSQLNSAAYLKNLFWNVIVEWTRATFFTNLPTLEPDFRFKCDGKSEESDKRFSILKIYLTERKVSLFLGWVMVANLF